LKGFNQKASGAQAPEAFLSEPTGNHRRKDLQNNLKLFFKPFKEVAKREEKG